jgi:hypothetical protein
VTALLVACPETWGAGCAAAGAVVGAANLAKVATILTYGSRVLSGAGLAISWAQTQIDCWGNSGDLNRQGLCRSGFVSNAIGTANFAANFAFKKIRPAVNAGRLAYSTSALWLSSQFNRRWRGVGPPPDDVPWSPCYSSSLQPATTGGFGLQGASGGFQNAAGI